LPNLGPADFRFYKEMQKWYVDVGDILAHVNDVQVRTDSTTLETRSLAQPYGALCCHKFKPKNKTDDIFLAQILGHKLLGPNASLSVGQSYKIFIFDRREPSLIG
jgi:hypothetical protein